MRLRFKAFGLCALVLGLMAFAASAAQAEPEARWMVAGANIEGATEVPIAEELEIEKLEDIKNPGKHLVLLTKILGILTHILCTTAKLINAKLIKEGGVSAGGKVQFGGCGTFLEESSTASAPCLPKTAGVNDIIETNKGKGLLKLFGGVGETLIMPEEGETLAIVESSAECAVGQKIKMTGHIVIKDCKNIKTEEVGHLIEVDNVNSTLKASGQKAEIHGSAIVKLAGSGLGKLWSGLPA
jgi:hypothetical protein